VEARDMFYEVQIVQQLSHKCFPFVFGICTEIIPQVVFELCSEVNILPLTVHSVLSSPHKSINIKQWYGISADCADALDYLHEHSIVHNDIKADNIVLTLCKEVYLPKIVDFNKARYIRDCSFKSLSVEEKITYRHRYPQIPPEVVNGLAKKSPSSDIYSFGYVLKQIQKVYCSELLTDISIACMRKNPCERPTAKDVVKQLN
jgi:serine/threonine protein kinase